MQDYQSLRLAVIVCTTLVNTQTHIQTDGFCPVILLAQHAAELKRMCCLQ